MVGLAQTSHSLWSIEELLDILGDLGGQSIEVNEEGVGIVVEEVIDWVDLALPQENILVEIYEALDLFKLHLRYFSLH